MILALLACRPVLRADGDAAGARWRWDETLRSVVDAEGRVDYDRLAEDPQPLHDYVAWLAQPARFGGRIKDDRHAMWLNAFNAFVIFEVLERGVQGSVLEVEGWLPFEGSGFFVETTFDVGGQIVSLADIRDEKIRLRELDLRDHAALVSGCASCPPLRPGLYPDDALDLALDQAMEGWVALDRTVSIQEGQAVFAPTFDRYARDFERWSQGESLCGIAERYARGPRKAALKGLDEQGCPHRFGTEDWSLNRVSR